ncbi:hypothetical protein ACWAUC_14680 [Bradyrhizobium guangdongense]
MTLPGPPFGDAATLDEAKSRSMVAWEGPEKQARAFNAMAHENRTGLFER